jgi:hypothetical protein
VYFVPNTDHFSRVFIADKEEHDLMAVTFGVAVGEHGPDIVLPDDARRATRYAILAIMLADKSASAGDLMARYGVNVTMRGLGRDVMADVEHAVRAEYRNADLGEFLETVRGEPVMPLGRHICDERLEEFGWKIWTLDDSGKLGDVYFEVAPEGFYCKTRTLPELKRCGRRVFLVEPRLPVQYTITASYCYALVENFDSDPPTGRRMLVATFGATAGRSTPIPARSPQHIKMGTRHTTTYYPLAVCIPEDRADVADAVRTAGDDVAVDARVTRRGARRPRSTRRRWEVTRGRRTWTAGRLDGHRAPM